MPSKPRASEVEPPPFPTKFAVNELVLCFHVGVLYDAKIVKIDASKGPKQVRYLAFSWLHFVSHREDGWTHLTRKYLEPSLWSEIKLKHCRIERKL